MIKPTGRYELGDELLARLRRYEETREHVTALCSALGKAQIAHREAVQELGKFLVPSDAKHGEQFNIWIGSELYCVEFIGGMPAGTGPDEPGTTSLYVVTLRKGGLVT